jgi:hypothetical protein
MPYELVKIPNQQCKTFWMVLIIFFFVLATVNSINRFHKEHFDLKQKSKKSKSTKSKSSKSKSTKSKSSKSKSSKSTKSNQNKSNQIKSKSNQIKSKSNEKSYNLGVCSKNCCATQWPVPINLTERSRIDPRLIGSKYFRSNLTCNNGVINTGCVCLTSKSKKLLGNRGYVKDLPMGNGLLEQDNRKSAFKIMEDKVPRPVNVLGQTTELTGESKPKITSGKFSSRFDSRTDRYRSIESEKELVKYFSMPIDNNMISFDNDAINKSLMGSNISGNSLSPTERLMSNPLGIRTKSLSVNRK